MVLNFCIGEEVQVFTNDWVSQDTLRRRVRQQVSMLEIRPVEQHQHAHAYTLKQADQDE